MSILFKPVGSVAGAGDRRHRLRFLAVLLVVFAAAPAALIPASVGSASTPEGLVKTFGNEGTEGGKFKSPGGVAVNETSGDVYVADHTNNRVQEFNSEGEFVRAWGENVIASGTGKSDAEQSVRVQADGGDFRLAFGGHTTAEIPWDASAVTVQTDLEALASIGAGNVAVSGGVGDEFGSKPYIVKFVGALKEKAQAVMTATSGTIALTGVKKEATVATMNPGETGFDICEVAADCKAGTVTATDGGMDEPTGIAVNQETGEVYVADNGDRRVDEFTAQGDFVRSWGRAVIAAGPGQADAQQSVAVKATGGSFTLTFGGDTTTAIAYDATATTVQSDLEALVSVGTGKVTVAGGPGSEAGSTPYVVTFTGSLGEQAQAAMTSNAVALEGTTKTATVAVMHTGATGFDVCDASAGDVCQAALTTGTAAEKYQGGNLDPSTLASVAMGIAVAPGSGGVLVGDGDYRRVQEYGEAGEFIRAFGDEVVSSGPDKVNAFDVCVNGDGDVCKEAELGGTGAVAPGRFGSDSPEYLAVAADGTIFATDTGSSHDRVLKFTPGATPAALTPSEFAARQLNGSPAPTALAMESLAGGERLLAVKPNATEAQVDEFLLEGPFVSTHYVGLGLPATTPTSNDLTEGLAYNAKLESVYYSAAAANEIKILSFTPGVVKKPTVSGVAASAVSEHGATFDADIDPEGFDTTYRFEYSTNGSSWTSVPAKEVAVGEGETPVPVSQTVAGLSANSVYLLKVVATDAGGVAESSPVVFTTSSAKPAVTQTLASPVGATEATLTGYVNPENSATSYYFEYGRGDVEERHAPAFDRGIGSGGQLVHVSETIGGLQPDTEYHYRLAATNAVETTVGPEQAFTTLTPEGQCPNEPIRGESAADAQGVSSSRLPDCRTYELVSPSYKEGAQPADPFASLEVADAGEDYVFGDAGVLDEAKNSANSGYGTIYESTRQEEGSGEGEWRSEPLDPPPALVASALGGETDEYSRLATSTDGQATLWELGEPSRLYRREASGEFVEVGPGFPPGTQPPNQTESTFRATTAGYGGASADLSHVLFEITKHFWPGDGTDEGEPTGYTSLYEYAGTGNQTPTLVSEDNAGQQLTQCGPKIAGFPPDPSGESDSVSSDGSTIFFEAPAAKAGCSGPPVVQLYARVGDDPATATTVNVAAASGCESSPYCGVSKPVTYDGASSDGAKVFFTSAQELWPEVTSEKPNVYECELPGDGGEKPIPEEPGGVLAPVNHCPSLRLVSATGSGEAAEVQGVVGISANGARVYYVAKGVVTSATNSFEQAAEDGADNLYVYDTETEETQFVATLAATDSADWTTEPLDRPAQTTPDGEYLLFASTADLTPEDTSSVAQIFRYDARTGELIRVSISQDGRADDGNTDTYAASIPSENNGGQSPTHGQTSAISEDGEELLFLSKAALAEGAVAGQLNVYEYRDGNVSLIYGQPLEVVETAEQSLRSYRKSVGIDGSGRDIFFSAARQLVGQDTDTVTDIYDARVDGGFKAPAAVTPCEGEACLGPLSTSLTPITPGSTSTPTIGNLISPGLKFPGETEAKTTLKPLTRAQKLNKALKSCGKDKRKSKRKTCVRHARKEFGQSKKAKK